jgi:hypothetical protein
MRRAKWLLLSGIAMSGCERGQPTAPMPPASVSPEPASQSTPLVEQPAPVASAIVESDSELRRVAVESFATSDGFKGNWPPEYMTTESVAERSARVIFRTLGDNGETYKLVVDCEYDPADDEWTAVDINEYASPE